MITDFYSPKFSSSSPSSSDATIHATLESLIKRETEWRERFQHLYQHLLEMNKIKNEFIEKYEGMKEIVLSILTSSTNATTLGETINSPTHDTTSSCLVVMEQCSDDEEGTHQPTPSQQPSPLHFDDFKIMGETTSLIGELNHSPDYFQTSSRVKYKIEACQRKY